MKIKPRSFPYPVLSKFSDDITPNEFDIELQVTPSSAVYRLEFNVVLQHSEFADLITTAEASLVVHVECQTNFYRKAFLFQQWADEIQIPVGALTGRVEVTFLIVACDTIEDYQINGFHADYGDMKFHINKADALGLLETKYFDAEKDPNALKKISSIIQVARLDNRESKAWQMELDDQKIFVRMPKADYERHGQMKDAPEINRSLCSLIVIPALVEALYQIKATTEGEKENERRQRWFRVLDSKLDSLGVDIQSSGKSMFEIAQMIMEDAGPDTLNELDKLTGG